MTANPHDDAVVFLKLLRRGGPWVLSAIVPDGAIETITAKTESDIRAFVSKHNGKRNLYYSVNPTRTELTKKAAKTDIAAIEYLPADLDPKKNEPSEAAKARFLAELEQLQPAPTAIVDSGNGIQVLLKLAAPIALAEPVIATDNDGSQVKVFPDETAKQIADIENRVKLLMKKLGSVAGTQNIDRILRLPGTINLPNATKLREGRTACPTKLIKFNCATCTLEDFPDAAGPQAGSAGTGAGTNSAGNTGSAGAGKGEQASLDDEFAFKPRAGNQNAGDGFGDTVLPSELVELIEKGVPPQGDLSAAFHHAVCWLADYGWSADRIERRIAGKPIVPARYAKRLGQEIARCLHKRKIKAEAPDSGGPPHSSGPTQQAQQRALQPGDFYALMTEHKYIFVPAGAIWPAGSVNARVRPVALVNSAGHPVVDEDGKQKFQSASAWLDQNRAVEQMTWAPGEPVEIWDRLIVNGGWIERPSCRVFNLYHPPMVKPVAGDASRWVQHAERLYGEAGAAHIIKWCAHRVQRPGEKINHAIVLGGRQGIGKDTLLEPVKYAVGAWNFAEVGPQQLLERFNGFLKSVILRVSEARDLGEFDRYAFYNHTKTMTAAPPDVLRIDEKNRQEYAIPNVVGVVITLNDKDSIYLPADDRRHYVAWSDLDKDAFAAAYWAGLWQWYANGGLDVVTHYLQTLDLADFNPKAPPPRTPAFFEIVNTSRTPEDAEMADALDALGWPAAVTIHDVSMASKEAEFVAYLKDRRNSRKIPHRFESCSYAPVRNPDADDGLWKRRGRRQVIYARRTLDQAERLAAARSLC